MFSLDWIKAKTELVGPAHLIHEFVEYRHILDEKVYINIKNKSLKDIHLILDLILGMSKIEEVKSNNFLMLIWISLIILPTLLLGVWIGLRFESWEVNCSVIFFFFSRKKNVLEQYFDNEIFFYPVFKSLKRITVYLLPNGWLFNFSSYREYLSL